MNKNLWKKMSHFSGTWTGTIIIVLSIIFFIAQAFIIPTGSMRSTLLIGDGLFGKKFSYGIPTPRLPWLEIPVLPDFDGDGHIINGDTPQRGDIVIFRFPLNDKIHYVKRCVAIGGDMIMMRNKELYLRPKGGNEYIRANYNKDKYIDISGELWVKNPYIDKYKGINYTGGTFPQELVDFGPILVPENEYFMIGDNRDHSNDSRFWGSVPFKYIVGTPWFIYFSWENRSYYEMLNSSDTKDIKLLQNKCGTININDSACQELWNRHQYSIRWDRMFKII